MPTTNFGLTDTGITVAGLETVAEGVNAGHPYVTIVPGTELRLTATGTTLTLTGLSDGGASPFSISVDGGGFTTPVIAAGWQNVPVFTALSDTPHAVIIRYSTKCYIDRTTTFALTGAVPVIAYSTGYAKAFSLRSAGVFMAVDPIWIRGNANDGTPCASLGASNNDLAVGFRATCTSILLYHFQQGWAYELQIDGVAQPTPKVTASTGAYGWESMFTGLDGTTEHLYRFVPITAANFNLLCNVMVLGGTGVNQAADLSGRTSILFQGDSITRIFPNGATNPDTRTGDPHRVGLALNIGVTSQGTPGGNTPPNFSNPGILPDIIQFNWGTNDCGTSVPVATFKANYKLMLAAARTAVPLAKIVCRAILPRTAPAGPTVPTYNTAIQQGITEIGDPNTFYRDFSAGFDPSNVALSYDGLHLTASGYAIVANNEIPYYADTGYTIYMPTIGTVGQPLTITFTRADASTWVAGETVTLTDGASGTFGAFTFTPGQTTATMQYTPEGGGFLTLSASNGQGWEDPDAIEFLSSASTGMPTCECVSEQPQLDKLRSIYCVTRQLAGNDSSLPTCECAQRMGVNELLDNTYCAILIWGGLS